MKKYIAILLMIVLLVPSALAANITCSSLFSSFLLLIDASALPGATLLAGLRPHHQRWSVQPQ